MEEKIRRGRPRMMLLDRMMKEDYGKLKERAGRHVVNGFIGHTNLSGKAENQKKKKNMVYYNGISYQIRN